MLRIQWTSYTINEENSKENKNNKETDPNKKKEIAEIFWGKKDCRI